MVFARRVSVKCKSACQAREEKKCIERERENTSIRLAHIKYTGKRSTEACNHNDSDDDDDDDGDCDRFGGILTRKERSKTQAATVHTASSARAHTIMFSS